MVHLLKNRHNENALSPSLRTRLRQKSPLGLMFLFPAITEAMKLLALNPALLEMYAYEKAGVSASILI